MAEVLPEGHYLWRTPALTVVSKSKPVQGLMVGEALPCVGHYLWLTDVLLIHAPTEDKNGCPSWPCPCRRPGLHSTGPTRLASACKQDFVQTLGLYTDKVKLWQF